MGPQPMSQCFGARESGRAPEEEESFMFMSRVPWYLEVQLDNMSTTRIPRTYAASTGASNRESTGCRYGCTARFTQVARRPEHAGI